jgi:hypothetical protein
LKQLDELLGETPTSGHLNIMRTLQLLMPLACVLAGCQAVLGLTELQADRALDASIDLPAADGVHVMTGRSEVAVARPRAQMPDAALPSPAVDAGVRPVAADPAGQAGVAGSSGSHAAGASQTSDDAGTEIEVEVEVEKLGNTGLSVGDILGYYSGDWGQMVLRKSGSEIWGVYEYRDGALIGELNAEGVFIGWWTQLPSRAGLDAGEVEFRWSRVADGSVIALDGRWRYGSDGEWLENWDILRVTDRSAPTWLSDRFERIDDFKRRP